MRRIEQILLLLLTASIPIQLGYHFWPPWAFVSGIRIDYLSPIFYFTDILLLLVIGTFIVRSILERLALKKFFVVVTLLVGITLLSIPNVVHFESYLYFIIRTVGYVLFGFGLARTMDAGFLGKIAKVTLLVSVFVIFLEITQFILQSSVQGPFYFLGERTFSLSTPGIARFVLDGSLILRPYATFPHPNVLAFYLFISLLFARLLMFKSKSSKQLIFYAAFYVLILLGVLLTFSRILIFCTVLLLCLDLVKKRIGILILALFGLFFMFFSDRFSSWSLTVDFISRFEHALSLLQHLNEKLLFGVGLNQYLYYQIEVERDLSPYFLQPPHNVPVLLLIQMGVGGILFFVWGMAKTIGNIFIQPYSQEKELKIILITTILLASLFDHYFITLHQGLLLTALVFGIFWAKKITE